MTSPKREALADGRQKIVVVIREDVVVGWLKHRP
jgi:hypothetical protein